jgi:hypothetical protein
VIARGIRRRRTATVPTVIPNRQPGNGSTSRSGSINALHVPERDPKEIEIFGVTMTIHFVSRVGPLWESFLDRAFFGVKEIGGSTFH